MIRTEYERALRKLPTYYKGTRVTNGLGERIRSAFVFVQRKMPFC